MRANILTRPGQNNQGLSSATRADLTRPAQADAVGMTAGRKRRWPVSNPVRVSEHAGQALGVRRVGANRWEHTWDQLI